MQKASKINASIEFCLRANRIPCFKLANIVSVVFIGRKRALMSESEMIGARKDNAFSPKHHFSPSLAKACPASAGPTMTATLNWIEFRAMALDDELNVLRGQLDSERQLAARLEESQRHLREEIERFEAMELKIG